MVKVLIPGGNRRRHVAVGGSVASAGLSQPDVLGKRERQVLQFIAEGHRSPMIAEKMGIAVATVEAHRRNILRKLQLHSVADLTRYALRHGIIAL